MSIATVTFTFHAFAWPNALPTTIGGESCDLRQFAKAANSEKAAWWRFGEGEAGPAVS